MLKVRDLMSPQVMTVRPETPIKDVATLLVEHRISGMPVVDDGGRVVGVISEGDLIVKEQGADSVERRPLARIFGDSDETRAQLAKVHALTAGDAMTAPAITITADRPIAEAAATMTRRGVNRLPVVEGDTLVGVVSRADIVRAFVRTDEQLADAVRNEVLQRALWLEPSSFDIDVTNGNVRIRGKVERRSEANMIERMTSLVPGVVGVTTEVDWSVDDRQIEAPGPDLVSPYDV
jgi:CBS domain-containing protein